MKKLYKSETDKKICGVLGGLAEYFEIDATILRLVTIVLMFGSWGFGIIVYFMAAAIIPRNFPNNFTQNNFHQNNFYQDNQNNQGGNQNDDQNNVF